MDDHNLETLSLKVDITCEVGRTRNA